MFFLSKLNLARLPAALHAALARVPPGAGDAARFPSENPNPVLRVASNGRILFANRASEALLESWGLHPGDCLPSHWESRLEGMLGSGQRQRTAVQYQGRVFELDMVPITARGYVNIYARDVTEQEAARQAREESLAELAAERTRLAALSEELRAANGQLSQRGAELAETVAELRQARDELEQRVQERTAELSRTCATLGQSEASFRAVFEGSRLGMAMVDMEGKVIRANPALRRILGYDEHELRQMSFSQFTHAEDCETDLLLFRELLAGKRDSYQLEKRYVRKDGRVIWGYLTASMARGDDGEPLFGVAMLDDITEHKQAHDELAASREQLRNLSRQMVKLQESERQYIARQLYDDEGQRLFALLVGLQLIEKEPGCSQAIGARVSELQALANGVLEDLHGLAVNLRPASLDKLGLVPTLRQHAEQFGRQHRIKVESELAPLCGGHLSPEAETCLYRVVQEALCNIAQHAQADRACLLASRLDGHLVLMIEDNGCGFDVDEAIRNGALGLLGMQQRAEMLGGKLSIESTAGAGTTVYVEVPIRT